MAESSLSEAQDITLSILPCFTSMLSCLGSAQIIFMVLTARKTTPYRRILLGLSVADFLCSIVYPWQAFLVPQATSHRIFAIGNDQTCSFLGFGQQIFFASILYNSMLSLYFLLTVRYGMSNPHVAQKYEAYMHLVATGYPVIAAFIGLGVGLFHELEIGHGCWVNDYPVGCETVCNDTSPQPCTQCTDYIFGLFFGFIPSILAFIMIVTNNILVYLHVRSTIQKSRRRFKATTSSSQQPPSSSAAPMDKSATINNTGSARTGRPSITASIKRRVTRKKRAPDPQLQRIRAVAVQACWYVIAFMMTYMASIIVRCLAAAGFSAEDEAKLFPLLVIEAILLPSQGLFNLCVYIRPSFQRTRRDYPNETYGWVFRRALYGEIIKPVKDEPKRRPSSSDFGGMVLHNSRRQTQSILHRLHLDHLYDPYWSGEENECEGNLGNDGALGDDDIDNNGEEVGSFAGDDDDPLSRRTQENYYSGDDNDDDLSVDNSNSSAADDGCGEHENLVEETISRNGECKTEICGATVTKKSHPTEESTKAQYVGNQTVAADAQLSPPVVEEISG